MDKHTLLVLDPGHFHAALTLRRRHPRLGDDVYVYADDGPDVDSFVRIVESFNARAAEATAWKLHLYRGTDHFARLRSERRGDVVIVAGRNDSKMSFIQRLHADGFPVLGDKPWLIDAAQLGLLQETTATQPLAMDIMTERHDVVTRVQKALAARPDVFGRFHTEDDEPAIRIRSVHHLYKIVNQRPLVRPAWYFDVAAQGEGITDVTTHLVDLVQWMTGNGTPFDYDRDVELLSARQWPTKVPRDLFARITGLQDFPEAVRSQVADGALHYLCNAALSYRVRGTNVALETVWDLAIPDGGGDTQQTILRGTRADLIVDQGPATRFVPELTLQPAETGSAYARALTGAIAALQPEFPGLGCDPLGDAFRITIPQALRTTHEQHFAAVLETFLGYIDSGAWPSTLGPDLVCKYTLLARAAQLSHRAA